MVARTKNQSDPFARTPRSGLRTLGARAVVFGTLIALVIYSGTIRSNLDSARRTEGRLTRANGDLRATNGRLVQQVNSLTTHVADLGRDEQDLSARLKAKAPLPHLV